MPPRKKANSSGQSTNKGGQPTNIAETHPELLPNKLYGIEAYGL